jgi:hypothetical protein
VLTVTSSASLALSPEDRIWVARRLPASSIVLTRSPERSSSSSSRVGRVLQAVVDLFRNAVDDGRGALLELAGDAVDAFVQHLVDAVGQIDELVVDVAGLEVEAGGQAFRGVEHGARGFRAGFLEAVEQVAAAFAERQDHVVAGVAQGRGNVLAVLFQRAGAALGDLVDAGGDRIRDQRDIVAKVDLHARNGAADLLGLADQVVALMGNVLKQRADAHFVVGIGPLQRRDFVGDQGFEYAGARDRAFDAVAHRRDHAPDRLADGDHGSEAAHFQARSGSRPAPSTARSCAFLAAPGGLAKDRTAHRRKEQRGEAAEHQHAPLCPMAAWRAGS